MKARSITLLYIFLAIVYFFVFARSAGKELIVSPKSVTTFKVLDFPPAQSKGPFLAIQSGRRAGFINEEHELVSYYASDRIALDEEWIVIHQQNGLDLLEPTGRVIFHFPESAYPIARDGNLYIYADDSGTLSKIDTTDGSRIWKKDYISQITSIDARVDRTLVGLLDGRIELIDNYGEVLFSYKPGGSRIEAIYGAILSNDASKIALISGLEPQRFMVLEERRNSFIPIHHHNANSDYRRPISMGFIRDDSQILYEGGEGIEIFDMNTNKLSKKGFSGSVIRWIVNLVPGTLTVLKKDEEGTSIRMLTQKNLPIFDFALPSDSVDIIKDGNFVIIVGQDNIAALEFSLQ
ncbi:hypothetical protein JY97_10015 [Alkalispirochaeta odontotermitis]|nr:hypothetical protein JY97_10015 [Alkalispirochaeta odontotermitis]